VIDLALEVTNLNLNSSYQVFSAIAKKLMPFNIRVGLGIQANPLRKIQIFFSKSKNLKSK